MDAALSRLPHMPTNGSPQKKASQVAPRYDRHTSQSNRSPPRLAREHRSEHRSSSPQPLNPRHRPRTAGASNADAQAHQFHRTGSTPFTDQRSDDSNDNSSRPSRPASSPSLKPPQDEKRRGSLSVRPEDEESIRNQFRRILLMSEAGLMSGSKGNMTLAVECEFTYKARNCLGSAIHIAALYRQGDEEDEAGARLVEILLRHFNADVNEDCTFTSFGSSSSCKALHIAAGRGNVNVISTLLHFKADIHAASMVDDQRNITALHDAVFFGHEPVVRLLLASKADVNHGNLHGSTGLHTAAKVGLVNVARILVEKHADLELANNTGQTALHVAVERGRFPPQQLHILARTHINDILEVAKYSASAAYQMLLADEKDNGEAVVHKRWTKVFECRDASNEQLLHKWVDLMMLSPRAAAMLLEAVTIEPAVENPSHHNLPHGAKFPHGVDMRCWYCIDHTWEYMPEKQNNIPLWHKHFALGAYSVNNFDEERSQPLHPLQYLKAQGAYIRNAVGDFESIVLAELDTNHRRSSSHNELVSVKVLQVNLPGLLRPEVLYALANSNKLNVFSYLPIQAIVNCAWVHVASHFHTLNIVYRIAEIVVEFIWVSYDFPTGGFTARITWSVFMILVCRDVLNEILELYGYWTISRTSWYLQNFRNIGDYAAIALNIYLILLTSDDWDVRPWPRILAATVCLRWSMLILQFRSIRYLGQQLIPLFNSMSPMLGILFIVLIMFFTFLHTFMALDLPAEDHSFTKIFLGAYGLLVVGDGGGIETILTLGGEEAEGDVVTRSLYVMSTAFFMVILVNLLIAVHGEAYTNANGVRELSFLKERAAMSLQCFLRPSWPPACIIRRFPQHWRCLQNLRHLTPLILLSTWGTTGVLVAYDVHPVVVAVIGLAGLTLCDRMLLNRPWTKESPDGFDNRNYLWVIQRADYDPRSIAPGMAVGSDNEDKSHSLVHSLRRDNQSTQRIMCRQVSALKQGMDTKVDALKGELETVREEVAGLRTKLDQLPEILLAALAFGPGAATAQASHLYPQTGLAPISEFPVWTPSEFAGRPRSAPPACEPVAGMHRPRSRSGRRSDEPAALRILRTSHETESAPPLVVSRSSPLTDERLALAGDSILMIDVKSSAEGMSDDPASIPPPPPPPPPPPEPPEETKIPLLPQTISDGSQIQN